MKTISDELQAHYASGTTTLATLAKLTRADGEVLAITLDHDEPIDFEGHTYLPALGMVPSTIETSGSMNVDNLDARGALMLLGVNESDISSGLWDMCEVRVVRVNWRDLSMGCEMLKRGHFGELSIGRNNFNAEVRGITQRLQHTIGELVTPFCNADLFDARCGVVPTEDVSMFTAKPVTAFTSRSAFTASGLPGIDGWLNSGKVVWTTGLNVGLSMEIKTYLIGGIVELQEPMPFAIAVDDEATFYSGCMKRAEEDCRDKYSNIINFRGFHKIPGQDQMFKGV